ncbi:MAG: SDR family NAD(P)-dependent oxidoreductase [Prolixibacteraceae bacterium]
MQNNMKEKVAVVTGAGGTLCSEMARELAGQGIKVALVGRTPEKLQKVETQIKEKGGIAISVSADVADQEAIKKAHGIINEKLGPVSVLINGAGGNQFPAITNVNEFNEKELSEDNDIKGFFNIEMSSFLNVIKINTMGTVIPCREFGKDMAKQKSGCIINIASMTSYTPLSRVAAYAIAKAGIVNFTQWLGAYLAPANIRVNAIAPGFFLNENNSKRLLDDENTYTERGWSIIRQTPMKRFGQAPELIGCMNWLIDDNASGFLTGVTIPIDGGFLSNAGI